MLQTQLPSPWETPAPAGAQASALHLSPQAALGCAGGCPAPALLGHSHPRALGTSSHPAHAHAHPDALPGSAQGTRSSPARCPMSSPEPPGLPTHCCSPRAPDPCSPPALGTTQTHPPPAGLSVSPESTEMIPTIPPNPHSLLAHGDEPSPCPWPGPPGRTPLCRAVDADALVPFSLRGTNCPSLGQAHPDPGAASSTETLPGTRGVGCALGIAELCSHQLTHRQLRGTALGAQGVPKGCPRTRCLEAHPGTDCHKHRSPGSTNTLLPPGAAQGRWT